MSVRQAIAPLAALFTLVFASHVLRTGQKPGCVLAQALLAGYAAMPAQERQARQLLLAGAYVLGPARTAAAAQRVRTRLEGRPPPAERAALLRMLAGLHADGDPTGLNDVIADDLRAYGDDADAAVARAAVLSYARLDGRHDRPAVLRRAHARGLIDGDTYGSALAALLAAAPAASQEELARALADAGGARAAQALAQAIGDGRARGLPAGAARTLLGFLAAREPAFPRDPALYFEADARRDARWVAATAALRTAAGGPGYGETVLAALTDPGADPRRALAFLSGPEGRALMREQAARARFMPALARAEAYARAVPGEGAASEAADDARFALSTLTR